jgi:hypothetical protein
MCGRGGLLFVACLNVKLGGKINKEQGIITQVKDS